MIENKSEKALPSTYKKMRTSRESEACKMASPLSPWIWLTLPSFSMPRESNSNPSIRTAPSPPLYIIHSLWPPLRSLMPPLYYYYFSMYLLPLYTVVLQHNSNISGQATSYRCCCGRCWPPITLLTKLIRTGNRCQLHCVLWYVVESVNHLFSFFIE